MKLERWTVFCHHIYELRRGLRNLILFTSSRDAQRAILDKLKSSRISYLVYPVAGDNDKINVYFGNRVCIEVLRRINKPCLADFTEEEDFILGIMLGYSRLKQCERFVQRKDGARRRQARQLPSLP